MRARTIVVTALRLSFLGRPISARFSLAALVMLAAACRGTEPFVAVPTSIAVSPGVVSLTALGATQRVTAIVLDQRGDPIAGAAVQWTSRNAAVATVDGTGLLTAQGVGSAHLRASVALSTGSLSDSALVTVSQVARRLVKVSGDRQTDTVSGTLQLPIVVRVEDSLAHPIPGITVAFSVTQGGGRVGAAADTSDLAGRASVVWTLGGSPGPNALSASLTGAGVSGNPAGFSADAVTAGTVPTVVRFAGHGQTGLIGFPINVPPAVLLRTAGGAPIAGATVVFAITGGSGTIAGTTAQTDAAGVARVGSWSVTAGPNELMATVQGLPAVSGNPVSFSATGAPRRFTVDVRFLTAMSLARQAVFTNAAQRWETLIFGDVADVPVSVPAGACGSSSPALNETIDDVIIFASIDSIDGPGGTLGQAGPCAIRSGSRFALFGVMEFDSADVASLESDGQFDPVIRHEMGHVLGYGTVWSSLLAGRGGTDPHFIGPQALAEFDRVGGTAYAGAKVPVENCCGSGTRDAHWRESVLDRELMTGFLDAGSTPLSVVTTASMGDMGYLVNYAGSDPFVLSVSIGARPGLVRALGDDVLRLPVMEIDATGRVVRVTLP